MTDEEIVAGALARTPGAFEQLVVRHQKLVWHLVYRMVRHPEDTRDLCQDVFVRVHQRLHQFRFDSTLASWIGRIAFTVAARHLERRRLPLVDATEDATATPLDAVADPLDLEAAFADTELLGHLAAAMDTLAPLQRTLLTLYHHDELGIPEIARIADLPEGTVKSHLFRARRKLRERLDSLIGERA